MKPTSLPFFLILCLNIVTVTAQEQSKWSDYWEKPQIQFRQSEPDRQAPDFFQSAALVWIRIYQKGISSQDLPSCVFHPSCSRFAFGAIERFGPLKGTLLAGDRLLRCNPFAHNYYQFDGEKFSDPVERYDLTPKK